MTDYEKLCTASVENARADVKGISHVSMMKITLADNGKDIHLVFKEDSDKKGWLPRPVLPMKTSAWKKTFKTIRLLLLRRKLLAFHGPLR
jgi:hypothetical protein